MTSLTASEGEFTPSTVSIMGAETFAEPPAAEIPETIDYITRGRNMWIWRVSHTWM